MNSKDIGFWLLLIGVAALLFQTGYKAYQRKSVVSTDPQENAYLIEVGLVAVGTVLLWPDIG